MQTIYLNDVKGNNKEAGISTCKAIIIYSLFFCMKMDGEKNIFVCIKFFFSDNLYSFLLLPSSFLSSFACSLPLFFFIYIILLYTLFDPLKNAAVWLEECKKEVAFTFFELFRIEKDAIYRKH